MSKIIPYWSGYILKVFIPALESYAGIVLDKVFPAFSQEEIEKQADRISGGNYDPDDSAFQEALEFYMLMNRSRQGLINTFAAGLYHLFEQQLSDFYRQVTSNEGTKFEVFKEIKEKLREIDVDVTKWDAWSSIEELRLLANCVKHGEGKACKDLRQSRPELFIRPELAEEIKNTPFLKEQFVTTPLSGNGIYFTVEEFKEKSMLLKRFWLALAQKIDQ